MHVKAALVAMLCLWPGASRSLAQASPDPIAQDMATPAPPIRAEATGVVPTPDSYPSDPVPITGRGAFDAEVSSLRSSLVAEVPHAIPGGSDDDDVWITRAQDALEGGARGVPRAELLVVVDRNPAVEQLRIVAADPNGPWAVVGGSRVSTGKPGRKEHYRTPEGVFVNTSDILGYRAEGTYNENHVRGLGRKGMRVWDFGWQTTEDWRHPGATTRIRLEMHATDPRLLEPRMGRPDSEGCIRLPTAMNVFLDRHGVVDADDETAAAGGDARFEALLRKDRQPSPLAGDTVVVVDSGEDPSPANADAS